MSTTAFTLTRRLPAADQKLRERVLGVPPRKRADAVAVDPAEFAKLKSRLERLERLVENDGNLRKERRLMARRMIGQAQAETVHFIVSLVAVQFGVQEEQILSKSRKREFVFPRHTCLQLLRELAHLSDRELQRIFGFKAHGTCLHARKLVKAVLATNSPEASRYREARRAVEAWMAERAAKEGAAAC